MGNFPKFRPKIQSYPFCLKIGTHGILKVLVPNPGLEFRNFDPEIIFWANLVRKCKSCPFCLKIGTQGILGELILHPDLLFRNSDTKILFWANLDQKIQSCPFCLKISTHYPRGADSASGSSFSKFWPQNLFLSKFGSKKSKLSVLPENQHTEYFEDADATLVSWISNPKSNFGQVWDKKVKAVCFAWIFAHTVSRGSWFLFWD